MYGILDAIASGPIDARTSENSTMVRYPFQSLSCLKLSIFFAFMPHGCLHIMPLCPSKRNNRIDAQETENSFPFSRNFACVDATTLKL